MPSGSTPSILWAPWRMDYVAHCDEPAGCIFCVKPAEDRDRVNLIAHRGKHAFVILNRFPYNNGHLMIVPYRHTGELSDLSPAERIEIFDLIDASRSALKKVMKPHGFNVGMNLGRTAGAGIAEHLHVHLVPRWDGDTNFMPVLGHTKVVSEGLEETWDKLKRAFEELTIGPL
jgi:ATP adenylyltransferase